MTIQLTDIRILPADGFGRNVLDGVSAEFSAGELTLVAGPSGAGKSTLLDVASGLRKPDEGSVRFEGEVLWSRRRPAGPPMKAAFVFQYAEHQLFARTVREEFTYSLKPYRLTREEGSVGLCGRWRRWSCRKRFSTAARSH
ncbi:ATP-binding cassette domain-containing protein [Paenibacillus sp. CC-CFT747]|nr:ATP-binding cassette domain-containing protein [Paenibacillus sp. CC-CFT747]